MSEDGELSTEQDVLVDDTDLEATSINDQKTNSQLKAQSSTVEFERSALVIGMGLFGKTTACALAQKGWFVLAVDTAKHKLEPVMSFVSAVKVIDAVNESAIKGLEPSRFGVCICAIGDENVHSVTLAIHNLQTYGAQYIIGRSVNEQQDQIFHKLGVNLLVDPEQAYAEELSTYLHEEGLEGAYFKRALDDEDQQCQLLQSELRSRIKSEFDGDKENSEEEQGVPHLYLDMISVISELTIWSVLLSVIGRQSMQLETLVQTDGHYPTQWVALAISLLILRLLFKVITWRWAIRTGE